GDKKNNWLLIKHRDDFARDNDGGALLAEDRSVASGRAMAEIAAGKGRGPTPFILAAKHQAPPEAIWNSNKGSASELRASGSAGEKPARSKAASSKRKPRGSDLMPEFVVPELCKLIDRPPSGAGWVHEVKFDGYRVQARVENGQPLLR